MQQIQPVTMGIYFFQKQINKNTEIIVVLINFVFLCIEQILKMTTFKSIWLWWGNTFLCKR